MEVYHSHRGISTRFHNAFLLVQAVEVGDRIKSAPVETRRDVKEVRVRFKPVEGEEGK